MRGQKLFNTIIKNNDLLRSKHKGRNDMLQLKRNECLLARYYYYGHLKNKSYEEMLHLLVNEFFLSPGTISAIVQDNSQQLVALKQKFPPLYYFQNHWPHFRW